jgi:hypothetical protein
MYTPLWSRVEQRQDIDLTQIFWNLRDTGGEMMCKGGWLMDLILVSPQRGISNVFCARDLDRP